MASVPPGGDLPRGHVLTLVVDADPGSRLDDWGLSATDADLSPLGDGVALGG